MSEFLFIPLEQIELLKSRDLMFADLEPDQQQELLGAVVAEHRDENGEWTKNLGGNATQAFLGSVHGLISMGVNKIRNKYDKFEGLYTHDDGINDFYADKNIGRVALNFLGANVSISTRIIGESMSITSTRAHANGCRYVKYPTDINSGNIISLLDETEVFFDTFGDDFYRQAVNNSGSRTTYDHQSDEIVQIGISVDRFRKQTPITTEVVTLEEEAERRILVEADEDDDELIGASNEMPDIRAEDELIDVDRREDAIKQCRNLPWHRLNEKQKNDIFMYYGFRGVKQKSYSEIAKIYGCSKQNIEQRISRALKILGSTE